MFDSVSVIILQAPFATCINQVRMECLLVFLQELTEIAIAILIISFENGSLIYFSPVSHRLDCCSLNKLVLESCKRSSIISFKKHLRILALEHVVFGAQL